MLSYLNIKENSKIFLNSDNSELADKYILVYKKWRFFYSLQGDNAPLNAEDTTNSGIPDYVEHMLYKFETANVLLTKSFGLRNPLEGGFFYDKGAKFIDIYISNIPREHGIASGVVYDEKYAVLEETPFQGKSLRITIHRNLIKKTATPIHELFHIFQYSYTHFNNMWFMEGLARWSQSIMQEKTGTLEPLPQNEQELDILIHKLHDAEFFFNNLITLTDSKSTFEIPQELLNNSEIYNNLKTGSTFMKIFLENCEKQNLVMQKNLKRRDIKNKDYWQRDEKRTSNNNQYIFKAIIDTVDEICDEKSTELANFIALIHPLAHTSIDDYNTKEIQKFLEVIKKANNNLVLSSDNNILYSEHFDIFSGTLSHVALDFTESDITDDELESFQVLKRVNGTFILKNCKNLTNLNGLKNLLSVDGDFILSGINLHEFNDLNHLTSVKSLHITFMHTLESINGLNALSKIKSNLLISNNKNLHSIHGFKSLNSVTNIEIIKTNLTNCDFLREVFKTQSDFNGFIKICDNKLENIHFMNGVKSVKSSLFLHQNKLENLKGLEELKSIGGSLSLSANRLISLKALNNLEKINGLLAVTNNNLQTLEGLENLKEVVSKKWGNIYFTLKIYGNKNLKDISALSNIQTKDNYIILYFDNEIQYAKKPETHSNFHKNILELHDFKTNKLIPTYLFVNKSSHNYENFRLATHNPLLTSLFDFEIHNAAILVLSFTGAYGNLGGLFHNKYPLIIENIHTHKIFIMDPTHTWYNSGIPPFTKNMNENIEFIRELILSKKYKKVVCMGASMGAYFSLLLGCILENEVDEVLAFSPQIFLDKANRQIHNDSRWATLIKNFPKDMENEYYDLKLLFDKKTNKKTKFQIHYGNKSTLDTRHVEHLTFQKNIALVAYDLDDHYITIALHKQGNLNSIILNTLKENEI